MADFMTQTPPPLGFMSLPLEVRSMIYSHVAAANLRMKNGCLTVWTPSAYQKVILERGSYANEEPPNKTTSNFRSLLHTSRQIMVEFRRAVYADALFSFGNDQDFIRLFIRDGQCDIWHTLKGSALNSWTNCFHKICHIRLHIFDMWPTQFPRHKSSQIDALLVIATKMPKLKTLHIDTFGESDLAKDEPLIPDAWVLQYLCEIPTSTSLKLHLWTNSNAVDRVECMEAIRTAIDHKRKNFRFYLTPFENFFDAGMVPHKKIIRHYIGREMLKCLRANKQDRVADRLEKEVKRLWFPVPY